VPSAPGVCLAEAKGHVQIRSVGPVEVMDVDVSGLPPKTEFDLFVIQVQKACGDTVCACQGVGATAP
jgi:hypothetical protein